MSAGGRLATARAVVWRRLARTWRRFRSPGDAPVARTADDAGTAPVGGGGGVSGTTEITPLLVDYFGRDGSTATMKLLSSSPRILVPGSYPFEVDRLGGVLAAADPAAAWASLAAEAESAGVAYYAEKAIDSRGLAIERLPLRIVAMLRDPRDTYVSIEAFSRAVGEEIGGDRETRLEGFLERQRERLEWIAGLAGDERARVVRYEDLATDLPTVARDLGAWLGVELDPEAVGSDFRLRWIHGTSANPARSVGRWRHELGEADRERIEAELGAAMAELGFEPS